MFADEAAQNNNSEATAMPRTGRPSSEVAAGSIEEKLVALKLSAGDPEQTKKIDRVLSILQDVLSGPNILVCGADQEALWWEAFAEVYAEEVAAQTAESGGREPSPHCKRQILADILVWAEVTQEHYDSGTLRFVTEPHDGDRSFQRIGRVFAQVKASKGLGASGANGGRRGSCSNNDCGGGAVGGNSCNSGSGSAAADGSGNAGARGVAGGCGREPCGAAGLEGLTDTRLC